MQVAPRNTIGNVPLEWYRDEKHIGYDIAGKKILKKEREDKLQSFLASADDSKSWWVFGFWDQILPHPHSPWYLKSTWTKFIHNDYHFMLRRKLYDEFNDEEIKLTKEEVAQIRRVLKGKAPHADFDPHAVCSLFAIL